MVRTKQEIEKELGGPIELIQLSTTDCILVNANARELHLPKNAEASDLWWARHPESGLGADFILGPALHVLNADINHLDLLAATCPRSLTLEERQQNMAERKKAYTAEEKLQCSLDNPDACIACGS